MMIKGVKGVRVQARLRKTRSDSEGSFIVTIPASVVEWNKMKEGDMTVFVFEESKKHGRYVGWGKLKTEEKVSEEG